MLAFYYFLLGAERRRRDAVLAGLCLAAVPLTNVHVVWNAAFLFAGLAAARLLAAGGWGERLRRLGRYVVLGGAAVLVSLIWVAPMLARLDWVPTMALEPPPPGLVVHAFFRLGVYLVLAAAVAWVERRADVLGLVGSLGAMAVFSALPTSPALENLAIQPGRILIAFQFLTALLVGYLIASVRRVSAKPWAAPAAGVACVLIFAAYTDPVTSPIGYVSPRQAADYRPILAALEGRDDGRVLVELGSGAPSDFFGLQALLGRDGRASLTTVFRESAVNALFAVPLRNSVSARRESFGVDSKMPPGPTLRAQGGDAHRARMALFNVRYFVVKSRLTRGFLERTLPVVPLSPADGRWRAYALANAETPGGEPPGGEPPGGRDAGGFAVVPAYEPVLTFAPFSVKRRPDDGYDFVRLGEEMFAAARLDVPLVHAAEPLLDRAPGLDRFRAALLTAYDHADPDAAYARLEAFSRERPLVLLERDHPLYRRLAALAPSRPHVRTVRRASAGERAAYRREARQTLRADYEARRRDAEDAEARERIQPPTDAEIASLAAKLEVTATCARLFDQLDAVRRPLAAGVRVVAARLGHDGAEIELDADPARPVPVWIRQGYLPDWRHPSGEPIHLATPTFQLTWVDRRRTVLRFAGVRAHTVGRAACGVGVAMLLGLGLWGRGREREGNDGEAKERGSGSA